MYGSDSPAQVPGCQTQQGKRCTSAEDHYSPRADLYLPSTSIPFSIPVPAPLPHLEQPVSNGLDEGLDQRLGGRRCGKLPVPLEGVDGLVGEVRADGIGSVTDLGEAVGSKSMGVSFQVR